MRHRIISFGRNLWRSSGPMPHVHGYAFKSASFHLRGGFAGLEPTCADPLLALARGEPTEMVGTVISLGLGPDPPVAVPESGTVVTGTRMKLISHWLLKKLSGGGDFMSAADKQTWLL